MLLAIVRSCLFSIIAFATLKASAQNSFEVSRFSDKYTAVVYYEPMATDMLKGKIVLFERQGKKFVFESPFTTPSSPFDGKSPHFDGDIVDYTRDYNFDGLTDFAIYNSPYQLAEIPTYSIFLATTNGFTYSKELSMLTACYHFELDEQAKQLVMFEKDNGFWQRKVAYDIQNGKPVLSYRSTIGVALPCGTTSDVLEKWDENSQQLVKTETQQYTGAATELLSFAIQNSQQQVYLYTLNDSILRFVLVKDDSAVVELGYPQCSSGNSQSADSTFTYNAEEGTLQFAQGEYSYTLYDTEADLGLLVEKADEKRVYKGVKEGKGGSLEAAARCQNVKNQVQGAG